MSHVLNPLTSAGFVPLVCHFAGVLVSRPDESRLLFSVELRLMHWAENSADIIISLEENIPSITLSLQIYFEKLNIDIFILCYQVLLEFYKEKGTQKKNTF